MNTKQKGFTIIEIIIAIVIIGVLALLATIGFRALTAHKQTVATKAAPTAQVVNCGTKQDDSKEITGSSDAPAQPLSDCFEKAYASCTPSSYTIILKNLGYSVTYAITGLDPVTKHCIGGVEQYSSGTDSLGTNVCVLDQATKPFLAAYTAASSGNSTDVAARCKAFNSTKSI